MGHVVGAIFLGHVLEHACAAVIVEVDVDIGEGDTVGVEKTLEQEVIFYGVDLGDTQTVGHARSCG